MRKLLAMLAGILISFTTFAEEAPAENVFALNTTAFLDKGILPVLYTCDGKDISPQFDWANPPAKTNTYALIVTDPEAPSGTFYHWVVYNIPKTVTSFPEGIEKLPAGVMIGKNSFGNTRYNGACPPKGASHTYLFTLYAIDTKLNLPAGAEGKAVMDAMKDHIAGKVEISAVYSRWMT